MKRCRDTLVLFFSGIFISCGIEVKVGKNNYSQSLIDSIENSQVIKFERQNSEFINLERKKKKQNLNLYNQNLCDQNRIVDSKTNSITNECLYMLDGENVWCYENMATGRLERCLVILEKFKNVRTIDILQTTAVHMY